MTARIAYFVFFGPEHKKTWRPSLKAALKHELTPFAKISETDAEQKYVKLQNFLFNFSCLIFQPSISWG